VLGKKNAREIKKEWEKFQFWQSSSFSEKTGRRKRGFGGLAGGAEKRRRRELFLFFFVFLAASVPPSQRWRQQGLPCKIWRTTVFGV